MFCFIGNLLCYFNLDLKLFFSCTHNILYNTDKLISETPFLFLLGRTVIILFNIFIFSHIYDKKKDLDDICKKCSKKSQNVKDFPKR